MRNLSSILEVRRELRSNWRQAAVIQHSSVGLSPQGRSSDALDQGCVRSSVSITQSLRQGSRTLADFDDNIIRTAFDVLRIACRQAERCLAAAKHFDIDIRQQFGIKKRAVLGAVGIVDPITPAQRIQAVGTHRMTAAGERQGINYQVRRHRRPANAFVFGIEKPHIECRVVSDVMRTLKKIRYLVDNIGKYRFVG